eukprot:16347-Amphidinium_carterae.1
MGEPIGGPLSFAHLANLQPQIDKLVCLTANLSQISTNSCPSSPVSQGILQRDNVFFQGRGHFVYKLRTLYTGSSAVVGAKWVN